MAFNRHSPVQVGAGKELYGGFGTFDDALAHAVLAGTSIGSIVLDNPGTGYTDTTVAALTFTGGSGTGLAATPVLGSGFVVAATITNGGTLYASPPTIAFSGGGGSGATAIAVVSAGVVVGIRITNPGTGYTSVPTIAFTATNGGSGAAATAVVSFSLASVTITNGGTGYSSGTGTPTVKVGTPTLAIILTPTYSISEFSQPAIVGAKGSDEIINILYPQAVPTDASAAVPNAPGGFIVLKRTATTLTVGLGYSFSWFGY